MQTKEFKPGTWVVSTRDGEHGWVLNIDRRGRDGRARAYRVQTDDGEEVWNIKEMFVPAGEPPRPQPVLVPDALLEKIAKEKLAMVTLATRKLDRADFYELPVWAIRDALQVAYQAGYEAAAKKVPMLKATKRAHIRAALYDAIPQPYEKMEALVRDWMAFPLATFEESLAAGFFYPDAANPVLKNSSNSAKK